MLIGGVLVPHGDQAIHGAVAGLLAAVHGGNGQEGIIHLLGVLNGGAVVGFQSGVVLLEVVLEQRHSLAEDHGVAGLAHDHTLTGFHAEVGHIAGLGHLFDSAEQGQHVLGGEGVLQLRGEGVAQASACAEDVEHIGSGDAGVGEHEAVAAVLGALLDDIQELLIGPAFLLDLGNVDAQAFHHGLVGADGLNGQVQRQAVGSAFQSQVLQSVLVVVGQTVSGHVLGDVNGDAHFHVGAQRVGGDLRDVGSLAGLRHGGQLVVVIAPGGLNDLHGQVGVQGMEVICPGLQVRQVIACDGGSHDHDGVGFRLCFRGSLGRGSSGGADIGALVSVVVLEPQAARPRTITTTSSMVTIFFISVILLVFKLALRHCRCAMRLL